MGAKIDMNVAIVGGGAAGLSAGHELAKRGYAVHLFERDGVLGGLAGSFMLDGGFVEKYYHFICLHDNTYKSILNELGLAKRLRWKFTEMGQYINGRIHSFGRPTDLLFFPYLTWPEKIRFGLSIMRIKSSTWERWRDIENVPVEQWLKDTFGESVYRTLHEPMVRLKFGEYRRTLSASWMWARIHRLGKSRTKIRQREKVGYLEGGSQILMDALGDEIRKHGGTITLHAQVDRLLFDGERLKGLVVNGAERTFDAVISTVPLPALLRLLPDTYTEGYWAKLRRIESIGVMCVFLRTRRHLTKYFWTNISDPAIDLAGIVEYTNLNPLPHLKGDSIIYLPQYLPSTAEKFKRADEEIIREYIGYLKRINPEFRDEDVKDARVFRDKYAQPICSVGFTKDIPDIRTPLDGFFLTDSSQLHPDDRTISNSLGLGQRAAAEAIEMLQAKSRQ
jgi:protoporphyrinogen oxidase